ncbi:radical SAM protein [Rhodopirellula sp. MGV]|uniref:radical SAM protein n=1 Tax=Rhodopirellula sp. MGV TaxID=2023130 RepID=UPI001179B77C|nr:radical SAM protein [Rhodopirellula sp. MGV]
MLDYSRPIDFLSEQEPYRDRGVTKAIDVNTVFLTARRCPVGCNMCDLHQFTREDSPPVGASVEQIDFALDRLPPASWIKLYNSGNFFDAASLPTADYDAIANRCNRYDRVIVENHPRIGRGRHIEFFDKLDARLEIAVGLETVHPRLLSKIGKQMTRGDFDRYAKWMSQHGIDLRVFLIVGAPDMSISDAIRWALLSARHAARQGARHISLIPARQGAGWGNASISLPHLSLSILSELFEQALEISDRSCISIDLWEFKEEELLPDDQNRLRWLSEAILKQRTIMQDAV